MPIWSSNGSRRYKVFVASAVLAVVLAASGGVAAGLASQGNTAGQSSHSDNVLPTSGAAPVAPAGWPAGKQNAFNYSNQYRQQAANHPVTAPSLPPGQTSPSENETITNLGISNNPGGTSAMRFQGVNSWLGQVGSGSYITVYAGGTPVDPSLQNPGSNAGVLVESWSTSAVATPSASSGNPNLAGTIYAPSPAAPGKLQIVSASSNWAGAVLTLQLVGTPQTYTFNTQTDTFGAS